MSNEIYQAFVSYFEENGSSFADLIKKIISEEMGLNAFVAHIERPNYSGDFETPRTTIIRNSVLFIFINTIRSLTREEIIREFRLAYPNGYTNKPKLVIFYHKVSGNSRSDSQFIKKTELKYDIAKYNQHDFVDKEELSTKARNLFYKMKEEAVDIRNLLARSSGIIPRISSVYIGYEKEMKELAYSLKTNNIVSVVGPGGIGKSSLIAKVLNESNFKNVISISISPESTLEGIISLIGQQINYPCSSTSQLTNFLEQLEDTVLF
ncbi:MAG: NB-ARC domain-containing protein, partial [Nitrososphaeraceae archaeon]